MSPPVFRCCFLAPYAPLRATSSESVPCGDFVEIVQRTLPKHYNSFNKQNNSLQIKERTQMQFELGDIIRLKKKHPCGSSEWEILRVGADFRLKCLGCGHQIMISRKLVEKNVKEIRKNA